MTANGWLQIGLFLLAVVAITRPLGIFITKIFNREKTFLDSVLRPIERVLYRLCGVDESQEMPWTEYGTAMLLFSAVSMLVLYLIERTQSWLAFNPQHLANVGPDLAWNTAASFTTNTNWQSYVPETTMSYLTQMAGLAYHNFASAAVGIALAIALIRGVSRRESKTIGNFWVDLTRCLLWLLLPICLVVSLIFVSQGVVQTLKPYATAALRTANRASAIPRRQALNTNDHDAAHRPGPGRLSRSHQNVRHQRRRLLQRQFARTRSKIPRHSQISCRCSLIFPIPQRPHLHAGKHDQFPAPRLGLFWSQ